MSQYKQDENPFEENENEAQASEEVVADSAENEDGEVTSNRFKLSWKL